MSTKSSIRGNVFEEETSLRKQVRDEIAREKKFDKQQGKGKGRPSDTRLGFPEKTFERPKEKKKEVPRRKIGTIWFCSGVFQVYLSWLCIKNTLAAVSADGNYTRKSILIYNISRHSWGTVTVKTKGGPL